MTLMPVSSSSVVLDRTGLVDRGAEHVHDAAERADAHRHRDRATGVVGNQVALQAVGGTERDRAHDAVAELLLHFQRDRSGGALHLERVVHPRHALAREFDVDDRADDLNDLALVHCHSLSSNS
jgi:peptide chain release factor 1